MLKSKNRDCQCAIPFRFKCQLSKCYQNFHQGFLLAKLLAAVGEVVAAVALAALATLSFQRSFSSQPNHYQTRL